MKHSTFLRFSIAALLVPMSSFADMDWNGRANDLLDSGSMLTFGETDDAGAFVLCLVPLDAASPERDANTCIASARIAGKRMIAGFVSGENIGSSEESESEYESTGDSYESNDAFKSKIRVSVDAFMRGVEQVAELVRDDVRYLAFASSAKTANAAAALDAAKGELGENVVRACGFAVIVGDSVASARDAALAAAKTSAVEMALGTAVVAGDSSLKDGSVDKARASVYSRSAGFIKSFRIEKDGPIDGGNYQVTIVAEVESEKLRTDFRSVLEPMGDLRFCVKEGGYRDLEQRISKSFSDWGCTLVKDAASADYFITYRAKLTELMNPLDGGDGTRLSLCVEIIDAATGKLLFSAENDPAKCVSYIGGPDRRRELAAKKAMAQMEESARGGLAELFGRMATQGREVKLTFDNCSPLRAEALGKLLDGVRGIPGCSSAVSRIDAEKRIGEIVFKCTLDMNSFAEYFEAVLKKELPSALDRPDTVAQSANEWNFMW